MNLTLVVVILIAAAGTAYFARLRRQRLAQRAGQQDLVCGGCGYSVIGLERMACPECGGDLREVGIVPPGYRRRTPIAGSIVLLLVTVLVVVYPVSLLIEEMAPWPLNYSSFALFSRSRSGAFVAVNVAANGSTWRAGRLVLPVTAILFLNNNAHPTMTVDVSADVAHWRDPSGQQVERKGVNLTSVLQWFAAAGIDATDRQVIEEARDIAIGVQVVARQPPAYLRDRRTTSLDGSIGSALSGTITRRVSAIPPAWIPKVRFWSLCAIALLGVIYIVRVGWLPRTERRSTTIASTT